MADKEQDEMLREAARARGFRLVKSRRRKAGGDFGKYGLTDLKTGRECFGFGEIGLTGTADEVLAYLRGGEVASWKRSLMGVVEGERVAPKAAAKGKERTTPSPSAKSRRGVLAESAPPPASRHPDKAVVAPERDSPPAIAGGAGGGSSSKPRKAPEKKPLQFRAATRRDAAAIARLIGAEPSALSERLAAALRAEEPPVVAEQDGIVGATAWTVVAMLHGPPRGRITLLHVAPDARRQGIGRQLLAEAERQLAEQGVTTIELLLDIDLDAPAGFLRKTGWQRSANAYGKIIR